MSKRKESICDETELRSRQYKRPVFRQVDIGGGVALI